MSQFKQKDSYINKMVCANILSVFWHAFCAWVHNKKKSLVGQKQKNMKHFQFLFVIYINSHAYKYSITLVLPQIYFLHELDQMFLNLNFPP